MSTQKKRLSEAELNERVGQLRKGEQERAAGYREKALKMFPWVCGRCTREFDNNNLRELTVHHIDHNHDNNPPDGSNWELLCIYCHEHEHTRGVRDAGDVGNVAEEEGEALSHSPFADLLKNFKQ